MKAANHSSFPGFPAIGSFPIGLNFIWISLSAFGALVPASAGTFAPPAGMPGSDALAADASVFLQWAVNGVVSRGPTNISSPTSPVTGFGTIADTFGPADSDENSFFSVVSLGDGGSATLTFAKPIQDVPGPDFAVFENSFQDDFLELAHVEVSSDGVNFHRFPSVSLTPTSLQLGTFGLLDATNLHNLAGKYRGGFGTPFDLAGLKSLHPTLDTNRVTHVRVKDVVGSINPAFGTRDSLGNLINDPFTTDFNTGGFDLDAIGALSEMPQNFSAWLVSQGRADVSPYKDFLGKGVPQGVEYFTGGKNLIVDSVAKKVAFDWLSYRSDGEFWIEASENLVSWQVLAKSTNGGAMILVNGTVSLSMSGTDMKRVTLELPLGSTYRFFRLGAK